VHLTIEKVQRTVDRQLVGDASVSGDRLERRWSLVFILVGDDAKPEAPWRDHGEESLSLRHGSCPTGECDVGDALGVFAVQVEMTPGSSIVETLDAQVRVAFGWKQRGELLEVATGWRQRTTCHLTPESDASLELLGGEVEKHREPADCHDNEATFSSLSKLALIFDLPCVVSDVPGDPSKGVILGPTLVFDPFFECAHDRHSLVTPRCSWGDPYANLSAVTALALSNVLKYGVAVTTSSAWALSKRRGRLLRNAIDVRPAIA